MKGESNNKDHFKLLKYDSILHGKLYHTPILRIVQLKYTTGLYKGKFKQHSMKDVAALLGVNHKTLIEYLKMVNLPWRYIWVTYWSITFPESMRMTFWKWLKCLGWYERSIFHRFSSFPYPLGINENDENENLFLSYLLLQYNSRVNENEKSKSLEMSCFI